jgi:hypothetical protein
MVDFIVIGASKSGTTWLAEMLRQHPQVFIPKQKELNYFNQKMGEFPDLDNVNNTRPVAWYHKFFKEAKPGQLIGDASPGYQWDAKAAENIHRYNPEIKLIAILRNPAERAYSQYTYQLFRGGITGGSFEQALARRPDILRAGLYYQNLQRYYALFPPENILVLLFDDLRADSRAFLRRVEQFLGVAEFYPPSIDQPVNVTGVPRFRWLNIAITQMRRYIRGRQWAWMTDFLRYTGLANLGMSLVKKNITRQGDRQPPDPQVMAKLRAYFRQDTEQLEAFLQRDLTHWKEPA